MIYELKVTLRDVGTSVWRRIQLDESTSFYDLHRILQAAFDWDGYHLHNFQITKHNGVRLDGVFVEPDPEESYDIFYMAEAYEETEEKISDWFKVAKDTALYTYDFGDDWRHEITFVKKRKAEKGVLYPRCVGAGNKAPEEDSRGEVIMGMADLEQNNAYQLINEINENFAEWLPDLLAEGTSDDGDVWEDLLLEAKEFHKLKPWNLMDDATIFAVVDPVTNEYLFCSVMGAAGESFGLAVYVGKEGYQALMNTLEREEATFRLVTSQRSITVDFENRENLEKEDYNLIKTFDVPFRGKGAWPSFRSYKPGYYPWTIDEEEARILLVALGQAMEMYKELRTGLKIPDLLYDEAVYAKVPHKTRDTISFKNEIIQLEDLEDQLEEKETEIPLAVSEIDVKRLKTPKSAINASIEFAIEYIDMPIQIEPGERPIFPLIALAVDHREGVVLYQNVLEDQTDIGIFQSELLKVFETIGGIPKKIMMNPQTAKIMKPLTKRLNLRVQTDMYISACQIVIDEFHNSVLRT